MKRFILGVLFFIFIAGALSGQGYKEFWFVAPEVYQTHGDRPIYMRISTTLDTAHIVLRQPARLSFTPIMATINPNSTFSIDLTSWIDSIENKPANTVLNNGFYLTSDQQVNAYYEEASSNNPEIFTMKGKNALGTEFYINGQYHYKNHWVATLTSESFDIVATEDNTQVTITVTQDIFSHAQNTTFMVMLNKGQTYSARCTNNAPTISLAGSHIVANHPVAITISDDSIDEPEGGSIGYDLIGDQIIPLNLLGKEYIAIKGFGNDNDERVYMEANSDSTKIYLDGSGTAIATINTAQNYWSHYTNNTLYIKSSNPISAYQLSGLPNEAGTAILPQDSCTGSRQIGFYRTGAGTFCMMLLTRFGNQDSFYLDGNKALITAADFNPVVGSLNMWIYARKSFSTVQVPVGSHIIKNTQGKFHMGILNALGGSAEYGFYSDYSGLFLGPDAYLCPGDSTMLDAGPGMTSYNWERLISGTWTQVGTQQTYTVLDSGYFLCTTTGDFCTLSDTIHFSLYPSAIVSIGPDKTICQGTTTTLDAGVFVSYLWSTGATGRYLTTGQGGSYWIRVVNNNGCKASDTVILTIDSIPTTTHAINGPSTVCQGQTAVQYTIQNLPFAFDYIWTLPPGASGSSSTNSIFIDFSSAASSGVLKVHGADSCGNGPDTSLMITVNPTPDLTNNPLQKTICSNTSTNITLTSDVSGALFTWTVTGSSPQVSGYSNNNIPTVLLDQLLINSGDSVRTVTYHITPHAGGCDGPVTDLVIFVEPVPHLLNSPTAKQQCNNTLTGITLTSNVAGALFTWTATGSSPQVSGYSDNSVPVVLLDQLLTNTGFNIETVIYHITPHANGCNGPPYNYTVTVYPAPDMSNNPPAKSQCTNTLTNITLTSDVNGTLFTWTASGSSPQVSGFSDNPVPITTLNQTLMNTGFNTETVIYQITPHANGCDGIVTDYTVTVFPVPDVYFTPPSQVICSQQLTNIGNNSHVSVATFTWTASGSSPQVTGYSAGAGAFIRQTLTNTGFAVETVTYQVSVQANGCQGTGANVTVTVNPAPQVTLTVCFDPVTTVSAQPFLLREGIPFNGTFSGIGVAGNTFTPSVTGPGTFSINYSYTNTYGCTRTASQNITVISPLPVSCGSTITDVRDNKQYPTVKIGNQCWMAANLDYGTMIISASMQQDNCIPEKYCFNDNPASCNNSGGLYLWDELMTYDLSAGNQGMCPPGWHLPTETEWTILFSQFNGSGFAGSPMKLTGFSGFNALLSGIRAMNTSWPFDNFATLFWSSTYHDSQRAWAHGLNISDPSVSLYAGNRSDAFSVRCLKD